MTTFRRIKCHRCGADMSVMEKYYSATTPQGFRWAFDCSDSKPHTCTAPKAQP